MHAIVAWTPLEPGQTRQRMAEAGQLRTEARCCPGSPPGGRAPSTSASARSRPHLREHRRRVDGWRRGRANRATEGTRQAVHQFDGPRLRAVISQLPTTGVRGNACRRHRRGGVADMGRLPQPRGTLALPHHDPRRSRFRDLRVGDRPQPPARDPESAPPRRAPSERREATIARRLCPRGRTAARGTFGEGRGPLRDRVLRRPPPCGD